MSKNKIPDIVVAQCQLYAAQAEVSLQITKDKLAGEAVASTASRRLRALREQQTAMRDAWAYLADVSREAAAASAKLEKSMRETEQ